MNALCLVLEGENIALLTIVKDYRAGHFARQQLRREF